MISINEIIVIMEVFIIQIIVNYCILQETIPAFGNIKLKEKQLNFMNCFTNKYIKLYASTVLR